MFVFFILLAIFAILTWKNLETGLLLMCALLPSYLIRLEIAGIPTTFLEMMALIVVVVWIIRKPPLISKERVGERSCDPFVFPIVLLLIAATIGIFISPDKHAALGVWKAFFVEPVLMFFVIRSALGTSPNPSLAGGALREGSANSPSCQGGGWGEVSLSRIFLSLGISALLVSLFGLIQYAFSIGIPAPWDLERRITSIFEYPNALALFLEPIIVISWFEIVRSIKETKGNQKKPKETIFWIMVSGLSTINVFLAQSEAGLAALIVTAISILLYSKITRKKTFASLLIIAALVFAVPTTRNYLVQKITFSDFSETVRLSQWKETVLLLKDHSIFGAGLGGYPIVMRQYHHDLQFEIFQYPHNIILNIWVELGILGLIAVFLLAFQLIRPFFSKPLSTSLNLFPFLFLEIFIHGLVDVPYFKNDLAMMMWILVACAVSFNCVILKKSDD